jgi:uncharacterized membrane protein YgcG
MGRTEIREKIMAKFKCKRGHVFHSYSAHPVCPTCRSLYEESVDSSNDDTFFNSALNVDVCEPVEDVFSGGGGDFGGGGASDSWDSDD